MPTDAAHPGALDRRTAPAEAVGPLMRGIAVLRALTEAGHAETPPDLARRVGLARASLDRVLATLEELDYVRVDRRQVTLAPPLMELGNAYLHSVRIPALLGPLAEELSDHLDEWVTLTVADDDEIRLVTEAVRPRKLMIACHVGDRLPVDQCAVGVLFATTWDAGQWDRFRSGHVCSRGPDDRQECADDLFKRAEAARRQGWAMDDQWMEPGLVAVSVPVRGPDGTLTCTVNVLSFTSRHCTAGELAEAVLPAVRESVQRMEEVLRNAQRPGAPVGSGQVRKAASGPRVVESLSRGLSVLAAFGTTRPQLSIADAARVTGLPRATARRALITLEHLGYVSAIDGRYRPKPAMLSLGYPVLSRLTLAQIATPHLEKLSARVGDSVSLAVLHSDTEIMYRARAATAERLTAVDIHVGTRLPAYATAIGRVLIAALPADRRANALRSASPTSLTPHTVTSPHELLRILDRIQHDGYALVDEELEAGLRSIAVPVLGHDNTTLAAVNVAMHIDRNSIRDCVTDVLPHLRAAAAAIHRDLGMIGAFHRPVMM